MEIVEYVPNKDPKNKALGTIKVKINVPMIVLIDILPSNFDNKIFPAWPSGYDASIKKGYPKAAPVDKDQKKEIDTKVVEYYQKIKEKEGKQNDDLPF